MSRTTRTTSAGGSGAIYGLGLIGALVYYWQQADGLWEHVAGLLPPPKPRRFRHPGRRPIDDRAALAGIVFVLKTGIAWNQLPTSLVGCSGVTCWRRLRDWTEAGVWPALHELLRRGLEGRVLIRHARPARLEGRGRARRA